MESACVVTKSVPLLMSFLIKLELLCTTSVFNKTCQPISFHSPEIRVSWSNLDS